jgi:hypothetical protein
MAIVNSYLSLPEGNLILIRSQTILSSDFVDSTWASLTVWDCLTPQLWSLKGKGMTNYDKSCQ